MFRLYVFTCCLQHIFYNRKKIPFLRFFFAGWKKSHLLEFFCWCKGKNPLFWAHRVESLNKTIVMSPLIYINGYSGVDTAIVAEELW